jgi:hypothetical protein
MTDSIVVDAETPESELAGLQATSQPASTAPDVPEKYRGKSMQDIIAMHQNAESELGRKNNEVGVIRRLADELIGVRATERQTNQPAPRKPITSDDILTDPEGKILEVVREATESAVRERDQRVDRLEADLQIQAFERKYPGFQTTMHTTEFGSWLQSGSEYRKRLAVNASQGDYSAADELFGLYKDHSATAPAAAADRQEQDGTAAARQAATVRSGGSNANGVVPSSNDKKIWSRTDLLDMRINRPDEFDSRQPEILAAYAEKRVR